MTQGSANSVGNGNRRGGLPRVHLASQSARRRELLTAAGIEHDAAHPGVDDGLLAPGVVTPTQWVMALAYLKASTAARCTGSVRADVVIGADTVVVHRGELLGQPRDAGDARRMIVRMRDDVHEVVTGVALVNVASRKRELFCDVAVVHVGHIADEQIEQYLTSGEWKGKAGAYNLSERLGAGWPIRYEGDPGTIMGLPTRILGERLRGFVAGGGGGEAADKRG